MEKVVDAPCCRRNANCIDDGSIHFSHHSSDFTVCVYDIMLYALSNHNKAIFLFSNEK